MTHEKQERVTCLDCLGRGRKKDGSGGTFACPRCGGKGSEPPEKQERIQGQGGAKQPPAAPTKEQIAAMMPKAAALLKELWRLECNGADLDEPVARALAAEVAPLADALSEVVAELLRSPLDLSLAALLAPGSPLCERVIAASAALRKAGRE